MKDKNLTSEERQEQFELGEKLMFLDVFPFKDLNTHPENTICVAWHWTNPHLMVTTGTAYAFRIGSDETPLKCDVYSFQPKNNGGATITHVNKPHTSYHHINKMEDLPLFIRQQAPLDTLVKIKKLLEEKESF